MLKRFIGALALVMLAVGVSAMWLHRAHPVPKPDAPLADLALPPIPVGPASGPAPAAPPEPAAAAANPPATPPAAASKESDLPTVEVGQLAVHTIDDNVALPIPTVTLHQKDGRVATIAPASPVVRPAPPSRGEPPAFGPAGAKNAAFGVAGLPVHLFGVRPPDPRDRCGRGRTASCGEGAKAALAARLGKAGNVRCTTPPGQPGDPGFVCRDGAGVDLGGLLVAEGLALADTSSSYNYIGAQNEARSSRRGLWAYR